MLEMRSVHAPAAADGEGVARAAASAYGFADDAALTRFTLTENATYRVQGDDREALVLRVYRPGGRPVVEIQSELAWMIALRGAYGPVLPAVVDTPDGAGLVEVVTGGPLGTCYCAGFTLAPGAEPDEAELARWFPRLGELTARFHRHARGWTTPDWFSRPTWDIERTLGEHGHWGPWWRSVPDRAQRDQLARLAAVVCRRLARFGTGHERFGLVHADLRLANVIVDGDDLQAIDFEDCGFSWYLYDLACALTFNEGREDVEELIDGWVAAYRTVEPMSGADEEEIPTFLMLRRLMLSAYVGLRPDIDLARELAEGGYNEESCRLAERYLGRFA